MRLALTLAAAALAPALALAEPQSIRHAEIGGRVETAVTGPGTGPETPFAIASVGKTFTAVAVLRLAERGRIRLDDPVTRYLPPGITDGLPAIDRITIGQLLTMTSGLPEYYTDTYFDAALATPDVIQRADAAIAFARGAPPVFRPGTGFDYSNTNYLLLGLILEEVTGQSYAEVLAHEVFSPAGMTRSFVFGSRALPPDFATGPPEAPLLRRYYSGAGFGDGGAISTATDLARFYRALFRDRTLLSATTLTAMLTDPSGEGYGMGIEIEDGLVGHSGGDVGFASVVRMDPRTGDLALILVADEEADTDWAWDRLEDR